MDDNKVQDLLLRLVEDMAIVKSTLKALEDLKLDSKSINARLDSLEAQNARQEHIVNTLEKKYDAIEEWNRDKLVESKRQQTSIFISMGIAVFSAILSFIINLL